jgi:hypothetical protein
VGETEHGAFQPATIKNISASGIRLLLKERYAEGTLLVVELTGKRGRFRRLLTVQVVQAAEQADGICALGCAFGNPLEGHELLMLVL